MHLVRTFVSAIGVCLLLGCKLRVMESATEPVAEPQQPSAVERGEQTRVAAPKAPPLCEPAAFHMVARTNTGIRFFVPASDGSIIVVSAHDIVAGASAGERALEQDAEWVKFQSKHEFMVDAVGGQWPEPVYITGEIHGFPDFRTEMAVRKSGEWHFIGLPSTPGAVSYYSSYHSLADGRVLAVREEKPEGRYLNEELKIVTPKPRKLAAPAWDVLIGAENPRPPPPPGGDVRDLRLLPDGGFVVLLAGLKMFRAASGSSRWIALPPLDPDFEGYSGMLRVSDKGQLYVAGCAQSDALLARWDGSHWEKIALPNESKDCLRAFIVEDDETLWVSQNGIYGRHVGGEWERVPITVGGFPDAQDDFAWMFRLGDTLWVGYMRIGELVYLLVTTQSGWSRIDLERMVAVSQDDEFDLSKIDPRCF